MPNEFVKCDWCQRDKYPGELEHSKKLDGMICADCDADLPRSTLGEIEANKRARARASAWNRGRGWVC